MAGALCVVFNSFGVPAFAHGVGCFARADAETRPVPGEDADSADLAADAAATRDREVLTKPVQGLLSAVYASARQSTAGSSTLGVVRTGPGSLLCFCGLRSPTRRRRPTLESEELSSAAATASTHEIDTTEDDILCALVLKQPSLSEEDLGHTRANVMLSDVSALSLAQVAANAAVMCIGWNVIEEPAKMRDSSIHSAFSHGLKPVLDALLAAYTVPAPRMQIASPAPFGLQREGSRRFSASEHYLHADTTSPLDLSSVALLERFVLLPEDSSTLTSLCEDMCKEGGLRNCLGACMLLLTSPSRPGVSKLLLNSSAARPQGRVRMLASSGTWLERLTAGEAHTLALTAATSQKNFRKSEPTAREVYLPHFTAGGAAGGRTPFRCVVVPIRMPSPKSLSPDAQHSIMVAFVCNKNEPSMEKLSSVAVPNVASAERVEWIRTLVTGAPGGARCTMSPAIFRSVSPSIDNDIIAILITTRRHLRQVERAQSCIAGDSRESQAVFWEREKIEPGLSFNGAASLLFASSNSIRHAKLSTNSSEMVTVRTTVSLEGKTERFPTLEGIALLSGSIPAFARTGVATKAITSFANASKHVWATKKV